MPVYIYGCSDCSEEFKVNHGMREEWDTCNFCNSTNIARIPSLVTKLKTTAKEAKVGDLTNEFIENAKKDLRQQKKGLDKKR